MWTPKILIRWIKNKFSIWEQTGNINMCGRCYAGCWSLYDSGCDEKPEALINMPLGMYHCPDCGAMVLAGLPHPPVCKLCRDREHPSFDEVGNG